MIDQQTHKAIVDWGKDIPITGEQKNKIEQAIGALIDALDGTAVEVTFSKIEHHGQATQESGSTAVGA